MARFCPLYSSSSGNCTYIGSSSGGILIDIGISAKRTFGSLWDLGVDVESIAAVFITHEHSDHVSGLRVFASKYNKPVYATPGTLSALEKAGILNGKFEAEPVSERGIEAGGMLVKPFKTSHDSRESCGYTIAMPDGKKIAVATDLGVMTEEVFYSIQGCDLVMLESNHDIDMLKNGEYPFFLKERILSDKGHLSNEICAQTAVRLLEKGTTRLVLGHLSKQNNLPRLAFDATFSALSSIGAKKDSDYLLNVAGGDCPEIIRF